MQYLITLLTQADASERFMECRQAYITLTDSRLRAEYDRRTQV